MALVVSFMVSSEELRHSTDYFLYLWDMEDKILYPGEEVQPVKVGDGYREYWLSDVVASHGYGLVHGQLKEGGSLNFHIFKTFGLFGLLTIEPLNEKLLGENAGIGGIADARIRIGSDKHPRWVSFLYGGEEIPIEMV